MNKYKILISILLYLISYTKNYAQNENVKPYFKSIDEEVVLNKDNGNPLNTTTVDIVICYPSKNSIKYLSGYSVYLSSFDYLKSISAYTEVKNEKGKLKKIPITNFKEVGSESEGIFLDDGKEIKFSFPGLDAGAEVHISYTIETEELHYFASFLFARYLDCKEMSYTFAYSDKFKVKFFEKNLNSSIKKREFKDGLYSVVQYDRTNIPAYEYYEDAPSLTYSQPIVLPILEKIKLNDQWANFLESPKDLFNWYNSLVENVNQKKDPDLQRLSDSLSKGAKSESEKIEKIYKWVQQNIRYVAFEEGSGGVIPRSASQVYNKRFGDCKDMSSLLTTMLNNVGIDACMTWIGTRSIPYSYEEVYTKNADNHMIAAVKKDNKWIFLDATDPNGIYGLPTSHIQGKQGMIRVNKDKFELVNVPIVSSKENTLDLNYKISIEGNDLKVHAIAISKGLIAGRLNNYLFYKSEKEKKDFVEGYFKTTNTIINLTNFNINIKSNNEVILEGDYILKNAIVKTGKDIYINPHFEKIFKSDKIDISKRNQDIEFEYNEMRTYTTELTIPVGYKLAEKPTNVDYKDKYFAYANTFNEIKNTIVSKEVFTLNLPELLLKKEGFKEYNNFLNTINESTNESLNFSKK